MTTTRKYVLKFEELRMKDVERVGGKNASLGEMFGQLARAGIRVPDGFATTAEAYRDFLAQTGLKDRIEARLKALDVDDTDALARCGAEIRAWITEADLPGQLREEIAAAHAELTREGEVSLAVRSSATAEDLPDASFAGQQETFLNIRGLDSTCLRRSTTIAPSPTACTRDSNMPGWRCPRASSAWSRAAPVPPA
jgi:pyruvate,water dikinase